MNADDVTLHHGDCLDVLPTLPDASVDAVVTDPPYGLEFMGKEWDSFKQPANAWDDDVERAKDEGYIGSDGAFRLKTQPMSANTATPRFTAGQPFQQWCEQWAAECLRVLKPGGHMLAFGGTRTFHRLAVAVEDAGFEIRDSIAWLYGSGFPKSLDVSKAIDRQRDDRDAILAVTSFMADHATRNGITRADVDAHMGTSDMGDWWLSTLRHRCQVPKLDQYAQLKTLLSLPDDMDAEVWRLNGRKGTPGEAWEQREKLGERDVPIGHAFAGSTYGGNSSNKITDITAPATDAARAWQGWGTALKPAFEPIIVARKPLTGTVAANVLEHGTGALNIDGCRIEHDGSGVWGNHGQNPENHITEPGSHGTTMGAGWKRPGSERNPAGRWPANVVLDADQAAALDAQTGEQRDGFHVGRNRDSSQVSNEIYGARNKDASDVGYGGGGGASRFFYTAKAPTAERIRLPSGAHPTVKPLDLMRWLVRLVTPPRGLVLDPFAGSGTTAEACLLEGFRCVAIEREADYLPLIRQRINRRRDPIAYIKTAGEDGGLFDLDEEPA